MVARATARADELTDDEVRAGGVRLRELTLGVRPRWLAVVGITAYRVRVRRPPGRGRPAARHDRRRARLAAAQPQRPERALAAPRARGRVRPPAGRGRRVADNSDAATSEIVGTGGQASRSCGSSSGAPSPSRASRSAHSSSSSSEHGVVDAGVEVAQLGVARRHRGDRAVAGFDVVDLVPRDRRRHRRLRRPAHRVGAADRVVAGVLVVVDEHRARVAVLAPPRRGRPVRRCAARPPGRTPAPPGARRRSPSAGRCARRCACPCRPTSSASRPRRARRAPRARRGRPGARRRGRHPASGRGRCATRRASRRRRAGSSTGGTRPSTSARPRSTSASSRRTARRRAGSSGGSARARSPPSPARRAAAASGAPSRRSPRSGSGAACTAGRAAR